MEGRILEQRPHIEEILKPLREQTRAAIIRYDNCVENGKKGGRPRTYESFDKTKEFSENQNQGIEPYTPEEKILDAIQKLAFGYKTYSHEVVDGKLLKVKYHHPNFSALKSLIHGGLRIRDDRDYKFLQPDTNTNNEDTHQPGS